MPLAVLQQKLNSFPEEYFDEINAFFDLLSYKVAALSAKEKSVSKSEVDKINAVLEKISESEQLQYCDAGLENVREALKNDTW